MSEALLQILDANTTIALEELLEASGLAREEVVELVEYGALELSATAPAWRFASHTIVHARRAARLRNDFGLDSSGMSLALAYLDRIEQLEQRIRELECVLVRGSTST